MSQRSSSNSGLVLFNALVPHGSLDSDGFFGQPQPQPHHEQQFVSNFDELQEQQQHAQQIPAQNHHQQQQQQQQIHSLQNGRFHQQQQQQQQQRDNEAGGSKEYASDRR